MKTTDGSFRVTFQEKIRRSIWMTNADQLVQKLNIDTLKHHPDKRRMNRDRSPFSLAAADQNIYRWISKEFFLRRFRLGGCPIGIYGSSLHFGTK